jgi:hypothetical protein
VTPVINQVTIYMCGSLIFIFNMCMHKGVKEIRFVSSCYIELYFNLIVFSIFYTKYNIILILRQNR